MKKELPKHPYRARFGAQKEIVCEFLPPARKSNKVVVLCAGMPSYPGNATKVVHALAERGYWVFVPRYAGSWESEGVFLESAPHEDVHAVIEGLQEPFVDFMTGAPFQVKKPKVHIIGASFGGAAALLASSHAQVKKVVALSPVVDWTQQQDTDEPLDARTEQAIRGAWGNAYRAKNDAYQKLLSGDFYNPVREVERLHGKKLLIIHAKDDRTVPFAPAKDFAETVGASFAPLPRGGHYGLSAALKPHIWRRIDTFFST